MQPDAGEPEFGPESHMSRSTTHIGSESRIRIRAQKKTSSIVAFSPPPSSWQCVRCPDAEEREIIIRFALRKKSLRRGNRGAELSEESFLGERAVLSRESMLGRGRKVKEGHLVVPASGGWGGVSMCMGA